MNKREALPNRRAGQNFELRHGGQNALFQVTIGYYPDGRIGEVFISGAKTGSDFEAVARDGAVLLSIALQFGVPLETIQHALTREHDGTPSTIIGAVVDRLLK
jgi:ribonucleoside-diphosphate reductase alpha chain